MKVIKLTPASEISIGENDSLIITEKMCFGLIPESQEDVEAIIRFIKSRTWKVE